jgi:large subunit ribosomal protein L14e
VGAIEVGRVCVKKAGRDAGRKCVIMKVINKNYVQIVVGGRKNQRKSNILHLEPTSAVVSVSDEKAVAEALK